MNRGSAGLRQRPSLLPCGFNEAPIHESGKCRPAESMTWSTHCFNEAPIHESGKCYGVFRKKDPYP